MQWPPLQRGGCFFFCLERELDGCTNKVAALQSDHYMYIEVPLMQCTMWVAYECSMCVSITVTQIHTRTNTHTHTRRGY